MRIGLYGMPTAGKTYILEKVDSIEVMAGSVLLREICPSFDLEDDHGKNMAREELAKRLFCVDSFIMDGHYAFGDKVAFTDMDGQLYDVILYLYISPDVLIKRMRESDKNKKYLSYDIEKWQINEIERLRDYCHKNNKDFYVIDNPKDNFFTDVTEVVKFINAIPYVYYDYGKLINEAEINKIDGIRLVFLDIRLEDGNEEAKNIYSVLASTIETIIGVNNGPYTIVLWTNEYQLKDEVEDFLMKRLSDEDTTRPTYICALDKKDFLEKPESLFGRVNDELNKNRPLEFLTTLESMTMEIPLSLLKMLLYETGNGIDPSSINKLLMLLASVESTDEIDNVKATKNILSVIADLVKDRYLDLTSNNNRISELAEYMDVLPTFDPNNVSIEVKARLNTAFNINTHGSENEKLPGKVYKTNQIDDLDSFDKSTFGKKVNN